MEYRRATLADRPAIRDVARRSLQASYSLGLDAITTAIEEWYDEDRLEETLSGDGYLFLVAERDGQIVGFTESTQSDGNATLLWLHVDPAYRGRGIGSSLFEATCDRLTSMGAERVDGRVLADNADGNAFYRSQGFRRAGQTNVEIADRTYVENRYVEAPSTSRDPIEADGDTVFVDHGATERGSLAPFSLVYTTEDGAERYGYYCSNCGSLANAMDAMGRIECGSCGNTRKPTRWDSAYL